MEALPDFALKAGDLKNVRLAAWTSKRSGAFPYSWHVRYTVLSANFLFMYVNYTDAKPRKVYCLDDAIVTASSDHSSKPFAFVLQTRSSREVVLATDSNEDTQRWIYAITNANYTNMYNRTRDAVKWLERCKDTVAPYLAFRSGIPVPEGAGSGQVDGDSSAPPPGEAAAAPPPVDERYTALKASLTGGDVIETIIAMRGIAIEAQPIISRLEEEIAQAREEAAAAGAGGAQGGDPSSTQQHEQRVAALEDEIEHLRASHRGVEEQLRAAQDAYNASADQNDKLAALGAELTQQLAAAKAAGAGGRPNPGGDAGGASSAALEAAQAEANVLRGHVQELQAAIDSLHAQEAERDAQWQRRIDRLEAELRAQRDAGSSDAQAAAASLQKARSAAGAATAEAERAAASALAERDAALARVRTLEQLVQSLQQAVQAHEKKAGGAAATVAVEPPARQTADSRATAAVPLRSAAAAPAPQAPASRAAAAAPPPPAIAAPSAVAASGATGDDAVRENAFEHEWEPFFAQAQRSERQGSYVDAEQQYSNVLDMKRERCGPDSPAVAASERDLGRVNALLKRFDMAEAHYLRSVDICAARLGEGHPNTACALTDLAAVFREQGKFEAAEAYAERAVASLRKGVGPDDVSTATALYNLAGLAKRQGKFGVAEASYADALRIFRLRLGEGQGETADTLYQMGCLYRKHGDYARAGDFFSQGADAYAKCYGAGDKRVAESTKRARAMEDKIRGGGRRGDADDRD